MAPAIIAHLPRRRGRTRRASAPRAVARTPGPRLPERRPAVRTGAARIAAGRASATRRPPLRGDRRGDRCAGTAARLGAESRWRDQPGLVGEGDELRAVVGMDLAHRPADVGL